MVESIDEISVNPQIMLLEQVIGEIGAGRLRVPRFQRPFVWRPEQMIDLFDSIERGYPIGSLLVWDTTTLLPSLDHIADLPVPAAPKESPASYLLDGHQRLSTLFGCLLRRPKNHAGGAQQAWMWDIYRVLGEPTDRGERFRHWRQAGPPPANYLPTRSILRTMDFLAYSRELSDGIEDKAVLGALLDEAEELAHRLKSYQIAVVRLKGGDLSHAVEVFSRLNSKGQSMTPDQMVSALTYRPSGDSLADQIEAIREDLGGLGYGQVNPITVFRATLAIAGEEDVLNARWEVLARRVRGRLAKAVEDTDQAIRRAVTFLRDQVRVPLARLIPYQHQVILLTAFFHYNPEPSPSQRQILEQWFWGTSWSGYFAGANSTQIKNALQDMKAFAEGPTKAPWHPQSARPFPERFDLRSARVRAFILWELRKFDHRLTPNGTNLNAVDLLARSDTEAYRHVVHNIAAVSHPANRIILPTRPGTSVRTSLLSMSESIRDAVATSHGIPLGALDRLRSGDGQGFVIERAEALISWEQEFMLQVGIEPPIERFADSDIDTE